MSHVGAFCQLTLKDSKSLVMSHD